MFKDFTVKDWIIGYFTLGIWIIYKMHKNGAPIGKVIGGFVGVIVFIGILGAIFGEKKSSLANSETMATIEEVKVDNSEAQKAKVEAEKKAETEKNKGLSYKDFRVGMDRKDIPSQIELIKGSKMSDYDNSFKYSDGNKNKIKIDTLDGAVSFVISDQTNKVKTITFEVSMDTEYTQSDMKEFAKKLTDRSFDISTIDDYKSGKLSSIILVSKEIKDGIENEMRIFYTNQYSSYKPNTLTVMTTNRDKKKSDEEVNQRVQKVAEEYIKKNRYEYATKSNEFIVCWNKEDATKIADDYLMYKAGDSSLLDSIKKRLNDESCIISTNNEKFLSDEKVNRKEIKGNSGKVVGEIWEIKTVNGNLQLSNGKLSDKLWISTMFFAEPK